MQSGQRSDTFDAGDFIKEEKLKEQLSWFVNLRWLAASGVFAVLLSARFLFRLGLPYAALYAGAAALLAYNIVCFFHNRKLIGLFSDSEWWVRANRFANTQISIDIVLLVYFIHFSGGIENPFIFYFVFHMVIASILLSNRAACMQSTLAVALMGLTAAAEHFQFIPHHHPGGFIHHENINNPVYVFTSYAVFATTLYITVYMATNIVNKLRAREEELADANERLEEQDRIKSRYVLRVSHDIQGPLATIQNCLKVVLGGYAGRTSDKTWEMIGRAEQKTVRLLDFVKDLLNLSRIKAMKDHEKSPVSLRDAVEKAAAQLRPAAEEKNISLRAELPPGPCVINADANAVDELLVNLLKNAIKYTAWKGSAGIQMKEARGRKGCFHFRVWDTGIGIPAEELPNIFDEFYRGKNAEDFIREGTGLGLSIVKEILKTLRGEIWVESEVGRGSSFFLRSRTGMTAQCA